MKLVRALRDAARVRADRTCRTRRLAAEAAKPRDTTPPTVPTGLRVVAATDDSVTVRWNASTDNSGTILRYQVNGIYHAGTSTQKTISFLVPNYTLTVRVQAVDPIGELLRA